MLLVPRSAREVRSTKVVRISPQSVYNVDIEIEIAYAFVDGATPNAARWMGALNAQWPGLRHGVTDARNVRGTDTVSQHTYGNAVDTFASWPVMDDIFDFGVASASAFSLRLLILRDVQWYSGSLGHYDGKFHGHVHADFWPQYPL